MLTILFLIVAKTSADVATEEIQFLNELPIDKLLRLKSSLQELVTAEYENVTATTPPTLERFGAHAMAMKAPIKRGDYEDEIIDKMESKISNIFSMSVTTLAFLAFGGYLLCLIVQAVKAKDQYYNTQTNVPQPTLFVSAGIKKKPQSQFASYGRRRRENREERSLRQIELSPEEMFEALLQLCEGYAKWNEQTNTRRLLDVQCI